MNTQIKYAPTCLQIKDSIVTDNKVLANEFNNFFNSIASNIDSKIIQTKTNFQDTLKNPNKNSFFIHPTAKEEIEGNIRLLKDPQINSSKEHSYTNTETVSRNSL